MNLLVVEDDESIAAPLVRGLERFGFEVTRVATGREALANEGMDLVLLDLGLSDLDGYEVCRRLRARSKVPIIVVTARGDEGDRVLGLELGADDYVVKPFGLRELVARIRAVARRTVGGDEPDGPQRIGALVVDRRTRRVSVGDEEVALAPKEFDLLALLADDPGAVVSRVQIMDEVWDPHWYGPTKTLDVHVASLRRKLGDPGGSRPCGVWGSVSGRRREAAGRCRLPVVSGDCAAAARAASGGHLRAARACRAGRSRRA